MSALAATILFGIGLMRLQPTPASGEKALMRLYYGYLEPIQIALRKPSRKRWFGIGNPEELPCPPIDLAPSTHDCVGVCAEIIEAQRLYLAKYVFCDGRTTRTSSLGRGIPLVIDLDLYPDFESYARRLRRRRKEIEKAGQDGFYCRPFDRHRHRRELFEIETSLRFRSGGPVLAAFFRRAPEAGSADVFGAKPAPPACPFHWYSDWGVFSPSDNAGGDRLVGYLFLKRVGNILRLTAMMGHGGWLGRGVVKLLFADAMRWFLDRQDPSVHGIRVLHYGAIEHGGIGLAAWKKRFLFQPVLFRWSSSDRCSTILVYVVGLLAT